MHLHHTVMLPELQAKALTGRPYALPSDFGQTPTLLFVVFVPKQQALVEEWLPRVTSLEQKGASLNVYELLLNAPYDDFYQDFINEGWINAIPQSKLQNQALSLFTDKKHLRDRLALPHEDSVFVLLVDAEGHITWRTEGGWTPQRQHSLEHALSVRGSCQRRSFAA